MATQTESNIEKRKIRRCPECKSTHLVERRDERCTVCLGCGFVISDETIKLASEERPSRESSKLLKPIVHFSKKTSSDENSEHDDGRIVSTLNQWKNLKTSDSGEKNLALALQQTTQIAYDLSLPTTALEKAVLIYKVIIEKGLTKGRSMKVMSATVIYLSCEQNRIGVTIKDLANVLKLNKKKIIRNYRLIKKELGFSMQSTKVDDRLLEISKRLQLSTRAIETALKISRALEQTNYSIGKDPSGIACGTIYLGALFSGEWVKQRELAEVSRTTEATIRRRIRELEKTLVYNLSL